MKKTILAVAFAIAGAIVAPAQTMSADIPFAFHIPGAQMPAGKYVIERTGINQSYTGYLFRPTDSTKSYFVAAPILKSSGGQIKNSQLTFRCPSEDQCELSEIQSAQANVRLGVRPSLKHTPRPMGTEIAAMLVHVAVK
jgi:hypothetical protein